MIASPPVSLIIVSYRRRPLLARLLKSLEFQHYDNFELIVVSDERPETPLPIRWAQFGQPNISKARNIGLAMARGRIVAFCDDDAVPEYLWLRHLVQPFADDRVGFAGGFVRGRNGVSFQWKAQLIDRFAVDHDAQVGDDPWTRFDPHPERVLNTVGTNFALRRDAAIALGGFDEAYRYFLDEADICMRLADAGWSGGIVPLAEVHHGFAAGPQRNRHRVPRDLTEIGASTAHFLAQHCAATDRARALRDARHRQWLRLRGLFDVGLLESAQLCRLMQGFDLGAEQARAVARPLTRADDAPLDPIPRAALPAPELLKAGPFAASVRLQAAELARAGRSVTVMRSLPTHNNLTIRYMPEGYWLHQAGVLGRGAARGRRRFRSATAWLAEERRRIAPMRGLPPE